MQQFDKDLVIIGGGPGGYDVAVKAAKHGLSVALIEKHEVGGTCLNYGCIPTKALYRNAEVIRDFKSANEYGISFDNYSLNFNQVQERKSQVIETLQSNIKLMLKKAKVDVIYGTASFIDEHTVTIEKNEEETTQLTAKYFIIATGSTEKVIPIKGVNYDGVYTSKDLLDVDEVPKRLVVIGGGVIGVEMASIFHEFGSEVVIIEFLDQLLNNFDKDISSRLKVYLKKQGIKVYTGTAVEEIEKLDDGLAVTGKNKKGKLVTANGDLVLMSTGRRAFIDGLNLTSIDVSYDQNGIKVSDNFQTSQPHIYAVGDVIGKEMLAHTATYHSYKALDHMLNFENKTNFDVVPGCVFTFPEIASVGLTEEQANNKYEDIKVNKFMFRANGKALSMSKTDGFIKVIAHNNRLIGAHIIGPHASDYVHEATVLIEQGIKILDAVSIIHAHPTLSESLLEALRGLIE
ncbi:dihydrolipoyl dehydrogenase [Haloplasma contractile]|uniref:Dihydrolipoyl dehydrogenase n=1 Tax=Haloplasma contractile SSD-17B TaxID=1033810 RepID=U2FMD6_9MOLU|nr:dihydrolipoyl dehydrogenase [Haloplasma contractile]ERJ13880.1 Dihydrolipoyl dehydrogenase protein [Haloplasma contractile SSD-17B]